MVEYASGHNLRGVPRVSGKIDAEGERNPRLVLMGLAIKSMRERAGLSQEKLAQDADIERAHMSKIETGRRNVTILNLLRIADALGCSTAEILRTAGL